ncbi:MAG: hypothetical protein PHC33_03440 [Candidatus Omnitrophica bacterium]|nr:hypothetical protein [Candidatus Omnitrophota bacterium]
MHGNRNVFFLVVLTFSITVLVVSSVLSYAQTRVSYRQETVDTPCGIENPRYCRECKDVDNRDFAKCDEIDYRTIDLLKSGRIPDSPPYLAPDREPGSQQVVFAVNIGKKNLKSEIFILDTSNPAARKRLTWDADAGLVNLDPFFTSDKKISYTSIDTRNKTESYFVIEDVRNGKRTMITREESDNLYLAAHKSPGKE